MGRPGFVLNVDERTPALLVHSGDQLRLERFPLGSRVVYPADPIAAVPDLAEAIDAALDAPLDSEPLAQRLRSGIRLTIAVDDITTPVPVLRAPDVRGAIIEAVLTRAAAAGVDDVAVVCATGVHRKLTTEELQSLVGERVFRSFHGDGLLTQHDAEATDALTPIGEVARDGRSTVVALNGRAAGSDLLVHVRIAVAPAAAGASAVAGGLGSTATISLLEAAAVAGDTDVAREVADLVEQAVPVFTVAAVLDNSWHPEAIGFLGGREWEWSVRERATLNAIRRGLDLTLPRARRRLRNAVAAAYRAIGVHAGASDAVRAAADAQVLAQQAVEVDGQSDVLVAGVPSANPYSVDSITNPVLAAWQGLVGIVGAHTGTPVVREGGAVILYHPLAPEFSPLHHPAHVDFYDTVLTKTTDAATMAAEFEQKFADDTWYRELYQTGHSFHGVHPFHLWYALAAVRAHIGDVVWVGCDRAVAHRLGFRAASTLADALEIVSGSVGASPRISFVHTPPALVADVR